MTPAAPSVELAIDIEGDLAPEALEMLAVLLVDVAFEEETTTAHSVSGDGSGVHLEPQ